MTKIKQRFVPVWHETSYAERGRPILVAETPINLLLRLKGTREVLELAWGQAYLKAAQNKAALVRIQKINAKRAKQKGKS